MKWLFPACCFMSAATATSVVAESPWRYKEVTDSFTDKTHYIASTRGVEQSGPFRVGFECRNERDLVFTIDAHRNLGGRNEEFSLQYRVDDKRPKKVRMRTFTNSETGGMNKLRAVDILNDMLNADRLRVRVYSSTGDFYDADLSLAGASPAILKTVNACGLFVLEG